MGENFFRVRNVQRQHATTKIGHYSIGPMLGRGSYASVHRAVQIFTKREVAVKIINTEHLSKLQIIKLRQEIEIHQVLRHPNIVRIYEFLQQSSKMFIFMELIKGKQLFEHICQSGPLSERNAAKVLHQICSAVSYLHGRGIVHRDIKTENIMVDSQLDAKLIDFGLADNFTNYQGHLLPMFCGSPSYMAPQMLERRRYDGTLIDVWCLGVSLYVMIEARLPFDQDGEQKTDENIRQLAWSRPLKSSSEAIELYHGIFRYSDERMELKNALSSLFFRKYHLQEVPFKGVNQNEEIVQRLLNFDSIFKISKWLNIEQSEVKIEIMQEKLGKVRCLYQLLSQQDSRHQMTKSVELRNDGRVSQSKTGSSIERKRTTISRSLKTQNRSKRSQVSSIPPSLLQKCTMVKTERRLGLFKEIGFEAKQKPEHQTLRPRTKYQRVSMASRNIMKTDLLSLAQGDRLIL